MIEDIKDYAGVSQVGSLGGVIVYHLNLPVMGSDVVLNLVRDLYDEASQLNQNLPKSAYQDFINTYSKNVGTNDPLFYHPMWLAFSDTDCLAFQLGSSDSIGFFLEGVMWGLSIYATPSHIKDALTVISDHAGKLEIPVVSSPFHLPNVEGEVVDFTMVRDFPYVDLMHSNGEPHTWDSYLASLKSKRRNALLTALSQGYETQVSISSTSRPSFRNSAELLARKKYSEYNDFRHAKSQLDLGYSAWGDETNSIVGVEVAQLKDGEVVSVTIAHVSNEYPSKVISHNSAVGYKDVGASAMANLIWTLTEQINGSLSDLLTVEWLNVCCETYVGTNLTGSYTQYLRHACNAEGMDTHDFISVVDKEFSQTLKPPFYNTFTNSWVH